MSKIQPSSEPTNADIFSDLTKPFPEELTYAADKKIVLPAKLPSDTETSATRRHIHALITKSKIETVPNISSQEKLRCLGERTNTQGIITSIMCQVENVVTSTVHDPSLVIDVISVYKANGDEIADGLDGNGLMRNLGDDQTALANDQRRQAGMAWIQVLQPFDLGNIVPQPVPPVQSRSFYKLKQSTVDVKQGNNQVVQWTTWTGPNDFKTTPKDVWSENLSSQNQTAPLWLTQASFSQPEVSVTDDSHKQKILELLYKKVWDQAAPIVLKFIAPGHSTRPESIFDGIRQVVLDKMGNQTILTVHEYSTMLIQVGHIFIHMRELPKCLVTHLLEHAYPPYREQAIIKYPIPQGLSRSPHVQMQELPRAILELTLAEGQVKRINALVQSQTAVALQATALAPALASFNAEGTLKKYKSHERTLTPIPLSKYGGLDGFFFGNCGACNTPGCKPSICGADKTKEGQAKMDKNMPAIKRAHADIKKKRKREGKKYNSTKANKYINRLSSQSKKTLLSSLVASLKDDGDDDDNEVVVPDESLSGVLVSVVLNSTVQDSRAIETAPTLPSIIMPFGLEMEHAVRALITVDTAAALCISGQKWMIPFAERHPWIVKAIFFLQNIHLGGVNTVGDGALKTILPVVIELFSCFEHSPDGGKTFQQATIRFAVGDITPKCILGLPSLRKLKGSIDLGAEKLMTPTLKGVDSLKLHFHEPGASEPQFKTPLPKKKASDYSDILSQLAEARKVLGMPPADTDKLPRSALKSARTAKHDSAPIQLAQQASSASPLLMTKADEVSRVIVYEMDKKQPTLHSDNTSVQALFGASGSGLPPVLKGLSSPPIEPSVKFSDAETVEAGVGTVAKEDESKSGSSKPSSDNPTRSPGAYSNMDRIPFAALGDVYTGKEE